MVDTGLEPAVVRARLIMLESLLDDVDRQFPALHTIQQRQGAAMWTDIPACQGFAREYVGRLTDLERSLVAIRGNVQGLLVNLAESAREMLRTEDDIRDRMIAIAEKLNAMPVTVAVPTAGAPSTGAPAGGGGYGSTMSGGGGQGSTVAV